MNLTVNGEPVSAADVEQEYRRLVKALGPRLPPGELERRADQLQRQALDHAIGRRLLVQEARRRGLGAPPEEIEGAAAALAQACGGEAVFQAHLEGLKLSRDDLHRQLLEARQAEALIAQVTAACPAPAEEEIDAYLEAHLRALLGGEVSEDSSPSPAALREEARRRLADAARNDALAAFIAGLRKAASISC